MKSSAALYSPQVEVIASSTPRRPPVREYLPALTGLRFLAALMVVFYHFGLVLFDGAPGTLRNVVASGYVGVSLFFVLSGFILAHSYADRSFGSPTERYSFYVARLARVYPVYVLGLIAAAPSFATHLVQDYGAATSTVARGALIAGLNVSLLQSWVPGLECRWNCPGWSLSVEAFFYALFPLIVLPIQRLDRKRLVGLAALLYVAMLIIPTLYLVLRPDGISGWEDPTKDYFWLYVAKFNPLVRLPEFVIGIVAGRFFIASRESSRIRSEIVAVLAVALITLVLSVSSALPYLLIHGGLLAPLFALLLISLAGGRGFLPRWLARPTMVKLGEASYALYILHGPLYTLFGRLCRMVLQRELPATPAAFPAYLAFAIAASLLVLRYIEAPARHELRRILTARISPQHARADALGRST